MPMPWTYRHASKEFASILADAKAEMGSALLSDNMTYTAVEGALLCFRRRLTPQQAVTFGDVLPSVLRAIFFAGWDVEASPVPWGNHAEQLSEVKAHRQAHNIAPDNAIAATAFALWRHVNHRDMNRVLGAIGPEAEAFWEVAGHSQEALAQRII